MPRVAADVPAGAIVPGVRAARRPAVRRPPPAAVLRPPHARGGGHAGRGGMAERTPAPARVTAMTG